MMIHPAQTQHVYFCLLCSFTCMWGKAAQVMVNTNPSVETPFPLSLLQESCQTRPTAAGSACHFCVVQLFSHHWSRHPRRVPTRPQVLALLPRGRLPLLPHYCFQPLCQEQLPCRWGQAQDRVHGTALPTSTTSHSCDNLYVV